MPKKPPQVRADALVVTQGLAADAAAAAALILTGRILATDPEGRERRVEKPGEPLRAWVRLRVKGGARPYVSRAGEKLAGALDHFGVDPSGWVCADIGLATGGFTDCLLRRGAARVHGVDVAYGTVDWRLRTDPRLILHERTNARQLAPGALGEPVRLAVVDVSFISLTQVLPAVAGQLTPDGEVVCLVKPQFEVPREDAPGGVVRDPEARAGAARRVAAAAADLGLRVAAQVDSTVPGPEGNVELLLHLVPAPRLTHTGATVADPGSQ